MKRPLFLGLIGLVLGEAAAISLHWKGVFLSTLFFLICCLCFTAMRKKQSCFLYQWIKKRKLNYVCYGCAGLFLLSYLAGAGRFLWEEKKSPIDHRLEKEDLSGILTGRITQLKEKDETCQIILEKISFIEKEKTKEKEPLCYACRGKCQVFLSLSKSDSLLPGETISCNGNLSSLEEPTNPGQFNSKIYDRSTGIRYRFFGERYEIIKTKIFSFSQLAYLLKNRMAAIYASCLSEEESALLSAMVLGDKRDLSDQQKLLYEENGVAHLLAVSGLHVSIIGGCLFRFLRKRGAGYFFSCISGSAALIFYGCMTGFGNSALRAVIMYLVYLGAEYIGTEYDMISAMSFAGILMLLEYPYRILEGGFQISFGSILAIGLFLPWIKERLGKRDLKEPGELSTTNRRLVIMKEALVASLVISAVTAPLIMRIFFEWCPYSVLLNLFVLPCMCPLMLSAVMGGLVGFVHLPAAIYLCLPARFFLKLFQYIFTWTRTLPGSLIVTGCPKVWQVFLFYCVEILVFSFWYFRLWRGFVVLVLLGAAAHCLSYHPVLRMIVLDVGQGECILMKMPNGKSFLIDGGSTQKSKIGRYILLPALKYYGIDHLDYVVVTHTDEDHISGIEELLEMSYPIHSLLLPGLEKKDDAWERIKKRAEENKTEVFSLNRGDQISMNEIEFHCFHPAYGFWEENKNAGSIVLYMKYREFDALFTGDLDLTGEEGVVEYILENKERYPAFGGHVEILKVAHHGSKYSTEEDFLNCIAPEAALISSGKGNLYGHPHKELLERLQKRKISIYQTQQGGAVLLKTDGYFYHLYSYLENTSEF